MRTLRIVIGSFLGALVVNALLWALIVSVFGCSTTKDAPRVFPTEEDMPWVDEYLRTSSIPVRVIQ